MIMIMIIMIMIMIMMIIMMKIEHDNNESLHDGEGACSGIRARINSYFPSRHRSDRAAPPSRTACRNMFLVIRDHHTLQSYSPLLKTTCVRQTAFDLKLNNTKEERGTSEGH